MQLQPICLETFANATQNITFTFDTAIADFDFIVFDVDQNDQVVITATDANGNVITDLSSWIVHGMGAMLQPLLHQDKAPEQ